MCRRLHADGVVRPRALRAWWGAGLGLRSGGSGGCGAPLLPAGGRSVRQLDLPDRMSARHRIVSEHEGELGLRICENLPYIGSILREFEIIPYYGHTYA